MERTTELLHYWVIGWVYARRFQVDCEIVKAVSLALSRGPLRLSLALQFLPGSSSETLPYGRVLLGTNDTYVGDHLLRKLQDWMPVLP